MAGVEVVKGAAERRVPVARGRRRDGCEGLGRQQKAQRDVGECAGRAQHSGRGRVGGEMVGLVPLASHWRRQGGKNDCGSSNKETKGYLPSIWIKGRLSAYVLSVAARYKAPRIPCTRLHVASLFSLDSSAGSRYVQSVAERVVRWIAARIRPACAGVGKRDSVSETKMHISAIFYLSMRVCVEG